MKKQSLVNIIENMSNISYILLKTGLMISCFLLSLSFILFLTGNGLTLEGYPSYMLAKELFSMPVSVLLITVIGFACLEDLAAKNA